MPAAWESAPLVEDGAPAWMSAPLVDDHSAPAVTPNDISGEGRDEYGNPRGPLGPGSTATLPSIAEMRQGLEPTPGWVSSGILPMATKEVSPGQGDPAAGVKWDWGPVRSVANPLLDLLEGTGQATSMGGPNAPLAGKVSPEGSALLFGAMMGNPNPLADAGAFMRGRNPMVAGGPFAGGKALTPAEAAAAITKSDARAAPLPADFRASPTAPGFDGPSPAPVQLDVGGGRTLSVPAANPVEAPAEINRNLPQNRLSQPPSGPPGAVGADITASAIPEKTRNENLTDMQKTVIQSAEDRAGPQQRDDTVHVPGVRRMLATREFTPQNALDDKTFRGSDPAYRLAAERIDRENNDIMKDLVAHHAGDQNAIGRAYDDRAEFSPDKLGVFANEAPVDASGMLAEIDKVLGGPDARRPGVESVLRKVRDSLLRENDDITQMMPSELYGYRKSITDALKKGAKGIGSEADDIRAAKSMLEDLIPTTDKTITDGAPKFGQFLTKWHELSLPIDRMEFLQNYITGPKKLTNDQGYLQPSKVQKLLSDIYDGQKARGPHKAKTITPEMIADIERVRNELAYNALRDRNASVRGSDTTQKLNRLAQWAEGPVGSAVKVAAEPLLHMGLGMSPAAGWGNAALIGVRAHQASRKAAQVQAEAAALAARKAELLETTPRTPVVP